MKFLAPSKDFAPSPEAVRARFGGGAPAGACAWAATVATGAAAGSGPRFSSGEASGAASRAGGAALDERRCLGTTNIARERRGLILVVIAVPSFRLLYYMDQTKDTEMVIKVTGNQWYWNYEYPDEELSFDSYMLDEADLEPGQKRLLEVDYPMVVPAGTRIKLLVTGNDVMHSFFVPSLAVQTYSIIGRVNEAWIDVPAGTHTYYGQCNQICGVNHAYMPIVVQALEKDEYEAWLEGAKEEFASVDTPAQPLLNETLLASAN